ACHKGFASSEGRIDLEVDENWYCEGCWQYYHNHRQCSSCSAWCTRGRADPETGRWACDKCRRAAPPAPAAPRPGAPGAEGLREPLLGGAAPAPGEPPQPRAEARGGGGRGEEDPHRVGEAWRPEARAGPRPSRASLADRAPGRRPRC
ncbi:unnamed protein product, partial [Prorocentrum cordatum]